MQTAIRSWVCFSSSHQLRPGHAHQLDRHADEADVARCRPAGSGRARRSARRPGRCAARRRCRGAGAPAGRRGCVTSALTMPWVLVLPPRSKQAGPVGPQHVAGEARDDRLEALLLVRAGSAPRRASGPRSGRRRLISHWISAAERLAEDAVEGGGGRTARGGARHAGPPPARGAGRAAASASDRGSAPAESAWRSARSRARPRCSAARGCPAGRSRRRRLTVTNCGRPSSRCGGPSARGRLKPVGPAAAEQRLAVAQRAGRSRRRGRRTWRSSSRRSARTRTGAEMLATRQMKCSPRSSVARRSDRSASSGESVGAVFAPAPQQAVEARRGDQVVAERAALEAQHAQQARDQAAGAGGQVAGARVGAPDMGAERAAQAVRVGVVGEAGSRRRPRAAGADAGDRLAGSSGTSGVPVRVPPDHGLGQAPALAAAPPFACRSTNCQKPRTS